MAKTKAQKAELLTGLGDQLKRMKAIVFSSISGYTMSDADKMRAVGKETGVELAVTKKTLLIKALAEVGYTLEKDQLPGSVLTSFGMEDEVGPAKIAADLSKSKETIKILGGIVEGKFVDANTVKALASLVSKKHQQGRLVGTFNAPVSAFARVLEAIRAEREKAPAA
jgi:large subunit ribosomal protein L10